ncbi:MAG: DPP IV N-terminal domain-containing protein [Anaerolineales bacterium]|nr:DPP IV N-terminal domain-containing protein [Anaerolineales bacterium]
MIDIETGREEMTSIKREEFLYISSNEQYFLYAVFNEESENYTISVYDHTTSTSQALLNALDLPWRGLIDVSPLDLRLAANISGQIYILQNDLTNTQQISDLDGYHNFAEGISWSPDGSKTIYLAEDLSSADEIATTRDLALYDLETVQLHLIEIGAIYPVPGDTAWSPDSQMIALTNLQDVLCIIDVGSVTHRCFNLIEQFGESSLGWYDWSPYEHKLALTVWMEEIEALNLYIFDPASGEFQLVAANITGGWVSWTK